MSEWSAGMQRRFTNRQVVTMVVALCAAVVLTPVGE
jgi:hypothetical protein